MFTMFWFWSIISLIFLIIELATCTFGFIFITLGSLIVSLLLGLGIITNNNILCQLIIMLFFVIISFYIFYKTFKKSKIINTNTFKENITAIVIEEDLVKGIEGKIKWSGTIINAIISQNCEVDKILINSIVVIENFRGNIAVVNKVN